MSVLVTKLAELALINLYFAEADIVVYGEIDERLEMVREHIREAEAMLRVIAPNFVDGPLGPNAPDNGSKEAA